MPAAACNRVYPFVVYIRVKKQVMHACHSYVHVYLMISTTCVIFEGAGRLLVVKEVHRCSR